MTLVPAPAPDFDALLAAAQAERRPISLEEAHRTLGGCLDERALADETLMVHGDRITLTPSTWIRVVRRAQHGGQRPPPSPSSAGP